MEGDRIMKNLPKTTTCRAYLDRKVAGELAYLKVIWGCPNISEVVRFLIQSHKNRKKGAGKNEDRRTA